MKRLLIFTLMLLLGCTLAFSQKNTNRKQTTSKPVAAKQITKKSSKEQSAKMQTNSQQASTKESEQAVPVMFEGEICYRNFENHSKMVRKFSKGRAYNGARNVKVLIKGNKLHIIDESMHLSTLVLPDEECVIVYNDLLKKGLKCSYSNYVMSYMSVYGPNPTVVGQTKDYDVKVTGETKTLQNLPCGNYKGRVTSKAENTSPSTVDVDIWYTTKYKVNPIYNLYLYGLECPGIAIKWTTNNQGKVPLMGTMSSFVASEVKAITPRTVEDSEMQIPADYELNETDSAFKMLGIYGDTKKYLKKHKMYPGDAEKDTEVTYQVDEEWNF